jgi:hypothetical protein
MFDDRCPIARATITPDQPIKFENIQPTRHDFPRRDDTMDSGAELQICHPRNDQFINPYIDINKNNNCPIHDQNNPLTSKAINFNFDEMSNSHSAPTNFRESLVNMLASTSPEDLGKIIQFIVLLVTSLNHGVPTPQAQAISANSDLKDVLELVLKVCGRQLPSARIDSSLTANVKLVWNAIVEFRCDTFQKVKLTKALQKKLKAKEIDDVLEFLTSEGGVLDKVEQNHIVTNGRAPSPRYKLLGQNPNYK